MYILFSEEEYIVQTFLDIEIEDGPVFNVLKKKEKNILTDYLKSKSDFIKEFNKKLKNSYISHYYKKLGSEFITKEDVESAFQYKIGERIKKFKKIKMIMK